MMTKCDPGTDSRDHRRLAVLVPQRVIAWCVVDCPQPRVPGTAKGRELELWLNTSAIDSSESAAQHGTAWHRYQQGTAASGSHLGEDGHVLTGRVDVTLSR